MLLTIIIGETGSGKSTYAKDIFKQKKNCFVYDFQNEYECQLFSTNPFYEKFKLIPTKHTVKDFVKFCENATGYNVFCEEATGLFTNTINEKFTQCVLSKRHNKNNYYLIFHSLHSVPPKLMIFCDRLVIFKTNDLEKNIESKYPQYLETWKKVCKEKRYYKEIINISNLVK